MAEACIVAIAGADRLPQLKERIGPVEGELLAFTDADALSALEAVVKRRPTMVALERLFAATPRGAALINRIKADRKLNSVEIKVFAHDSDIVRVVPRPEAAAAPPLDQRGTRRAPRVRMAAKTTAIVEGKTAALVDLSTIGAQVVTPVAVKIDQQVSIGLVDKTASLRFSGKVAWTSFEIQPNSDPRYRAGIEFVGANPPDVEAFAERHRA